MVFGFRFGAQTKANNICLEKKHNKQHTVILHAEGKSKALRSDQEQHRGPGFRRVGSPSQCEARQATIESRASAGLSCAGKLRWLHMMRHLALRASSPDFSKSIVH